MQWRDSAGRQKFALDSCLKICIIARNHQAGRTEFKAMAHTGATKSGRHVERGSLAHPERAGAAC